MKILVTGGNGLVGTALISLLRERGDEIAVLDKVFSTENFPQGEGKDICCYKKNLANLNHVLEVVSEFRPEKIFHLGSMLSVPCENNIHQGLRVNVGGIYHILEAARLFGVKQVIYSSTLTTFDRDLKGKIVDDETVQRPTTLYGITKYFGENLGRYYRSKYGIDFRAARFSAIVGPGAKTKHIAVYNAWMIEKSIRNEPFEIFVTPETQSSLTYYKDAAQSLVLLSEAPKDNIRTVCYNLPGVPISAEALAREVERMVPTAQLTYKPDPEIVSIWERKGRVEYDGTKAKEEWGWGINYTVEEMIRDFGVEIQKMNSVGN